MLRIPSHWLANVYLSSQRHLPHYLFHIICQRATGFVGLEISEFFGLWDLHIILRDYAPEAHMPGFVAEIKRYAPCKFSFKGGSLLLHNLDQGGFQDSSTSLRGLRLCSSLSTIVQTENIPMSSPPPTMVPVP